MGKLAEILSHPREHAKRAAPAAWRHVRVGHVSKHLDDRKQPTPCGNDSSAAWNSPADEIPVLARMWWASYLATRLPSEPNKAFW